MDHLDLASQHFCIYWRYWKNQTKEDLFIKVIQARCQKVKKTKQEEKISIIFQNNNLLNDFTALENVLMPLYIKGHINQN